MLWELQAWQAHTLTHFFCVLFSSLSSVTHSQIKVKVLAGGNGHRQHPQLPPSGRKEVEGWGGQAAWPGKGRKEQRGQCGWIDRVNGLIEIRREKGRERVQRKDDKRFGEREREIKIKAEAKSLHFFDF